MFAASAAVFLAAALAFDVAGAGRAACVFAVAGIVLLGLAVIFPPANVNGGTVSEHPHFGFTRHGLAVHQRTADHHPAGNAYQRFNKRIALRITAAVGTMTTFWLFCLLALCSLPSVLSAFAPFAHTFPAWMVKVSIIALVAWVAQTFIQLVLLPALMVGQNLQNEASDARSAKTFEDIEAARADLATALDRLDEKTDGGIKAVLDAVTAPAPQAARVNGAITLSDAQIRKLAAAIQAANPGAPAPPKAAPKRLATPAERGKATGK